MPPVEVLKMSGISITLVFHQPYDFLLVISTAVPLGAWRIPTNPSPQASYANQVRLPAVQKRHDRG